MARLVTLAVVVLLTALPCGATNAVSLGYIDETTIIGPARECSGGTLIHNHDGSFESGYAWQYSGCAPPYYGAFGEGYDLGAGTIACAAFWLSTLPNMLYTPDNADCYVWEGGVDAAPGAVLGMVTGPRMTNIPWWPAVGQNDVEMDVLVTAPFTMGYWGPWPEASAWYFCAADQNGPGGHPWTCIAPGIGYPSGWQDPAVVWPNAKSMGCGVYFEQSTPAESETWGAIKAMFRR
jgi:hypothetical protein